MKKSDGTNTKKPKATGVGKQRILDRNTLKSSNKLRCSNPKCTLKQHYEKPIDETQWPDTKQYRYKLHRSLVCRCNTDGKDNKIQFFCPVKKKWLQHSAFYRKTPRSQNTTVTVVQNNEDEEDTEDKTMDSMDFSQNHCQQLYSIMDVKYNKNETLETFLSVALTGANSIKDTYFEMTFSGFESIHVDNDFGSVVDQ
jgi:hypothetical protein